MNVRNSKRSITNEDEATSSKRIKDGAFLEKLPNELRLAVMSWLDEGERYKIGRVNRTLRGFMRGLPHLYRRTNLDRTIVQLQLKRGRLCVLRYLRPAESSLRRVQFSEHIMFRGEMLALSKYLTLSLMHVSAHLLHFDLVDLDVETLDFLTSIPLSTTHTLVCEMHQCSITDTQLAELFVRFAPRELHICGNFDRRILNADVIPLSASRLFIGCLSVQGHAMKEYQPNDAFFNKMAQIWREDMKNFYKMTDSPNEINERIAFLEMTAVSADEQMIFNLIKEIFHEPRDQDGHMHYRIELYIYGSQVNRLRLLRLVDRFCRNWGIVTNPAFLANGTDSYSWSLLRADRSPQRSLILNIRDTEQERYLITPKLVLRDKSVDSIGIFSRKSSNTRKRRAKNY